MFWLRLRSNRSEWAKCSSWPGSRTRRIVMTFPAAIRDRILYPVRAAKLTTSLTCDTPLVDAIELRCEQGTLIALSKHTLRPLERVVLRLNTDRPVTRVESVRHGPLPFVHGDAGVIRFSLPLDASDFVMTHSR